MARQSGLSGPILCPASPHQCHHAGSPREKLIGRPFYIYTFIYSYDSYDSYFIFFKFPYLFIYEED